jgi:PAS domain S-box-containing protein
MEDKLFKSFFDNTIEGIIIIKEGFIVDINTAMLDILKYTAKNEVIGNLATGILIPKMSQKYLEYDHTIFEEVSLVSKEGEIIPAIIKIKDIELNNISYKMVFILNLTELKKKENMLLEQSRMAAMGETISMIAHQWRQPLSSISAALSNLKLRIKMKKYTAEILENKIDDIDKYLLYMSNTIDDFRNFFKSGKEKELVSLNYIVDIALDILKEVFEKNSIEVINSNNCLDKINIFKNEFLQVILNILNNSTEAFDESNIKDNKYIKIDYEEYGSFQKLSILDNAGGISNEIIGNIFEPYYSTKSKKNGTGLGLYMSKIIVENHCNGKIYVTNKENGVCFDIVIQK